MADTKISALSAVTDVQTTDEFVLARAGTTKKITGANLESEIGGGGGLFNAYAYLRNEQSSGTQGGASTTGSFQTVVINTEVFDTGGIVSLSSNQFTLAAGTYLIVGRLPMFRIGLAKLKIRNVTDSTDAAIGVSVSGETTVNGEGTCHPSVTNRITIAGTKAFELQYRCTSNDGGNTKCLGPASSFSVTEVYGEVEIWRES